MNSEYQNKRDFSNISISEVTYKISIPVDDFFLLNSFDPDDYLVDELPDLLSKKFNLNLNAIDYSGHFGSFVYVTLNEKQNTEELKNQIVDTIFEYLNTLNDIKESNV